MKQKLCECGCGEIPKPGNRFIKGHWAKTKEARESISFSRKGQIPWNKGLTKDESPGLMKLSIARLKRKEELGYVNAPETRKKIGGTVIELWKDSKYKKKQSESHIESWKDPEYIEKMKKITKEQWQEPDYLVKTKERDREHSKRMKAFWQDLEYLAKMTKRSEDTKVRWQDSEYREKTLRAIREGMKASIPKSPNIPEMLIQELLNVLFPNDYKYVGDKKFWIEGCNPDFVNINGQKKLIEHQGDYWHANPEFCKANNYTDIRGVPVEVVQERNKEKLETYERHGYQTLVIWEHELSDIDKLKTKVIAFVKK